jgi:hypothetical protein
LIALRSNTRSCALAYGSPDVSISAAVVAG